MANFLNATILPGDNIPKHEHKKMFIVLSIVLVIALVFLAWFVLYGSSKKIDIPITDTVADQQQDYKVQMISQLKAYEVPMTDKQKTSAVKELSKYSVTLTDKQKADQLAELQKYSIKK